MKLGVKNGGERTQNTAYYWDNNKLTLDDCFANFCHPKYEYYLYINCSLVKPAISFHNLKLRKIDIKLYQFSLKI